MSFFSKFCLYVASKLPFGYYRILKFAASRDKDLWKYKISLTSINQIEILCDFRESVFTSFLRHGSIPHQNGLDNLFKKMILPGDVIFDIGANIGYTALLFGKLTGKNGRVIAFEPGSRAFFYLNRNIAHNAKVLSNIEAHKIAVSDKAGELKFYDVAASDTSSLNPASNAEIYNVKTSTIDEVVKEHGIPQFIKIDVEGHETQVLLGAATTLSQNRPPIIIFEALYEEIKNSNMNVIKSFCSQNYSFHRIDYSGEFCDFNSDIGSSDYIAIPEWAEIRF
jgi:FkbM family methyltransferase